MLLDVIYPLVQWLYDKGRTNYVSVLYEVKTQVPASVQEALIRVLRGQGYFANRQGFITNNKNSIGLQGLLLEDNTLDASLRTFKAEGNFRTIVVLLEAVGIIDTIKELAEAAEVHGMNNGDHVWVFFGTDMLPLFSTQQPQLIDDDDQYDLVRKLLQGAALIDYVDGFIVDGEDDPFLQEWRRQDDTMIDLLKEVNPVLEGQPGYFMPNDDYFQTHDPVLGSGFIYDSIMSVGIGACIAESLTDNSTELSGNDHVLGIQLADFQGATGHIVQSDSTVFREGVARNVSSGMYGVFNLFPPGSELPYVLTDVFDPTGNSIKYGNSSGGNDTDGTVWIPIRDFIFSGNTTTGPELLRDEGYYNYLSEGVRIFGLCLFAVAALLSFVSAIWIIINWNHAVLRAAQPYFLLPICLGSLLQACCIVFISFDENYGTSLETLNRLCRSIPWCFITGNNLTYCALFGKVRMNGPDGPI